MLKYILALTVSLILALFCSSCNDIMYSDTNIVIVYPNKPQGDTLNLFYYIANNAKEYSKKDTLDFGLVVPAQMNGLNIMPVNQKLNKTDTLYSANFKGNIGFICKAFKKFPLFLKPLEIDSINQIVIQFVSKNKKPGTYFDTLIFNGINVNGLVVKAHIE